MTDDKPSIEAAFAYYGVDITGLHGNRLVRCPVHDEHRPSCSVNLDKNVAQCFACDFAGDAFTLIMAKEGIDFASSVRFAEANLAFTPSAPAGRQRPGLSGVAGAPRASYQPRFRKRARLSGG